MKKRKRRKMKGRIGIRGGKDEEGKRREEEEG